MVRNADRAYYHMRMAQLQVVGDVATVLPMHGISANIFFCAKNVVFFLRDRHQGKIGIQAINSQALLHSSQPHSQAHQRFSELIPALAIPSDSPKRVVLSWYLVHQRTASYESTGGRALDCLR
jgi:hypothetical protein